MNAVKNWMIKEKGVCTGRAWEDFPDYLIFEQRPEGSKEVNHIDMWGNSTPGRRNSTYMSLTLRHVRKEQGLELVGSRINKEEGLVWVPLTWGFMCKWFIKKPIKGRESWKAKHECNSRWNLHLSPVVLDCKLFSRVCTTLW